MLRASDIIDMSLVVSDKKSVDRIKDWILDVQNNQLVGFLISRGGWLGGARILLWDDITSVSPRSLITDNRSPVIEIGKVLQVKAVLENPKRLVELELLTRQGRRLGQIIDFYFEESNGVVIGLAVANEGGQDGKISHTFVPVDGPLDFVDGVVLATPEMTASACEEGKSEISDFDPKAKPETQVKSTIGHRAQYDVRDGENFIIAAAGQLVTDNIIKKVRKAHQEVALLQAVGLVA